MDATTLNKKRLDNEISSAINLRDMFKEKKEELKKDREFLALQVMAKEKGKYFIRISFFFFNFSKYFHLFYILKIFIFFLFIFLNKVILISF